MAKKEPWYVRAKAGKLYGERLTTRELEVVACILRGVTRHEDIARELVIERKTVTCHLSAIYAKAGAKTMAELALMAVGHLPSVIDFDIAWR